MSGSFRSRTLLTCLGFVLACSGDVSLPSEPGPPVPASLRIVSGNSQQADAGATLESPLTVQVVDAEGQPVADVPVEFGFVDDLPNAGVAPSSMRSSPAGEAMAFAKLGSVPGEQLIAARVAGSDSPELKVQFRAIALRGTGGGGDGGDDDDNGGGDDGRGGGGEGGRDDDDDDDDDDRGRGNRGRGGDDDRGGNGQGGRGSGR